MGGVVGWEMALEQVDGNKALLTRPVGRRVRQHMDDRQVETRLQRLQFFAEGDRAQSRLP